MTVKQQATKHGQAMHQSRLTCTAGPYAAAGEDLQLNAQVELLLDGTAFAKGVVMAVQPTVMYNGEAIGPDSIVVGRVELSSSRSAISAVYMCTCWSGQAVGPAGWLAGWLYFSCMHGCGADYHPGNDYHLLYQPGYDACLLACQHRFTTLSTSRITHRGNHPC